MEKFFLSLFCCIASFSPVSAGERSALRASFEKEYAESEKQFENAVTNIELTGAAGKCHSVAEKHLLQAMDHKLRHTEKTEECLRILQEFREL